MFLKRVLPYLLPLSWVFLMIAMFYYIQGGKESRLPQQIGFGLVGLFYALRYWNKQNVRFTDTIKCILVVFWCGLRISFASGVKFEPIVFYALFLIGLVWLIMEIIDLFKGITRGHRLILLAGGALIGLQVVMRIERFPGASVVMLVSFLVTSVGFIAEAIVKSKTT